MRFSYTSFPRGGNRFLAVANAVCIVYQFAALLLRLIRPHSSNFIWEGHRSTTVTWYHGGGVVTQRVPFPFSVVQGQGDTGCQHTTKVQTAGLNALLHYDNTLRLWSDKAYDL